MSRNNTQKPVQLRTVYEDHAASPEVPGYKPMLEPPESGPARERFEHVFQALHEETLPCGHVEWMAMEQIAALEVRRLGLQQQILDAEGAGEIDLSHLQALSKLEADALSRLDRAWQWLRSLQSERAQRRGMAIESALVSRQVQTARQEDEAQIRRVAEKALLRELIDLGMPADKVWEAVNGLGVEVGVRGWSETVREAAGLPRAIPGPPWDPWRGVPEAQLREWEQRAVETRRGQLLTELAKLDEQEALAQGEAPEGASPDAA